ncbi:MAG: A24 family peptidase [Sphingomonas bacterium]|nr:A24 family peptidase [Sphingomonas bacterium]
MPIPYPMLFWPIMLGLLGTIIGSFVAALVVRWPDGRSVTRGRSVCDSCGRALNVVDLVPLFSAMMLRGKCRRCQASINPIHWRIEGAAAIIGVAAGLVAPGILGIAGAVFGWLLLTLGALDLVAFWLPDRLTIPLALTGLFSGAAGVPPALSDRAIGGVAGFGALWTVAFAYRQMRGREGMGAGDPKLFGAIGLWLGWQLLPAALLVASMTGLCVVLVGKLRGETIAGDMPLPFGTLLAVAAYPAWLVMIGLRP